jgi:hypothetical protein
MAVGVATAMLLTSLVPSLLVTAEVPQAQDGKPIPSTIANPLIVEYEAPHGRDLENFTSTGNPYIYTIELAGVPDNLHKVRYEEASWIQKAMDMKGQLVDTRSTINPGFEVKVGQLAKLDEAEHNAFFGFLAKAQHQGPYYEVTFPDGSVKYYDVMFVELPY